ncbi:g13100 [Coccomyxa viridis]|uniref:Coatomer subunit zeta n=1 Tax=Coccomyxa viridis TaxID=1274662 RepID=A0ABP1GJ42_9CHLO
MEGQGRIQCVLIATTGSNIVYERFYERFTDIEKADIRHSFQQTQSQLTQSTTECIGRCRAAATVAYAKGDLVYHAAGTGEYDELALAVILRFLVSGLHDALRKAPSEAVLLDNYARVCVIISEIINEGVLEIADRATLLKALKIKGIE